MTRSFRRSAAAAVATLGLVLSVVSLLATPAGADSHGASPPGNNGTIKVDEQGIENGPGAPNSNDPHIACVGRVEYYGIDEGTQDTQLSFEVHPPTLGTAPDGTTSVKIYNATITGSGPGGPELDGSIDFDLTDLLAPFEPHPRQGYHVKVTTHTTFSQGADTKHKVFWIAPCPGEEDDLGALQVSKDVTGDDEPVPGTLFGFTVACTNEGQPIDLTDDASTTTATFTLADAEQSELFDLLPVGASCTITETEDRQADSTTWVVDDDTANAVVGDEVTVVIEALATVAVVAVNDFQEEASPTGGLTVLKQVRGNDRPTPTTAFGFRVSCTLNGSAVDINGTTPGNDVTFTRTGSQGAFPISGIPTGASCTVTETQDHDPDSTTWLVDGNPAGSGASVSGILIGDGTTIAVVATNTFNTTAPPPDTGSLSIDKAIGGDGQPAPGTRFSFRVTCVSGGQPVDLNGDATGTAATFTLTVNQAARVLSGIPTGAECTVTETNDRGASETTWTVDGSAAGTGDSVSGLVIGDGTTVAVVVTNLFEEEVAGGLTPRPPVVTPPVVTPPAPPAPTVTPRQPQAEEVLGDVVRRNLPRTPAPPAPTVTPRQPQAEQVLGNVVRRDLPRTGDEPLPLLETGLGLILLGAGVSWSGRRRRPMVL